MINKLKEFVILHGKVFYLKTIDSFFVQKSIFKELDSLGLSAMEPAYVSIIPEDVSCYEEALTCLDTQVDTIGVYSRKNGIIMKDVVVKVETNELDEPIRIILKCVYSDTIFEGNSKIPSNKRMKPFISLISDYEDRRI